MNLKTFTLCTAVMLSGTAIHAQQKAGTFAITPKVGITSSNFSGTMPAVVNYYVASGLSSSTSVLILDDGSGGTFAGSAGFTDSRSKVGFTGGVEAQYQFNSLFGMSLGVMYMQQGARYQTAGFTAAIGDKGEFKINNDLKINLHTIAIPVLANVYVWRGLAVKAGLQPEFAVSRKLNGNMSISYDGDVVTACVGDADHIRKFALSIPVGISYEYKHIVADCRYHIGLTDLKKDGDARHSFSSFANERSCNRTLSFTIGYKFEL